MTNYRQYQAADFAADASFQAWVQHGSNNGFWSAWEAANPDRAAELATARELVLALRFHSTDVDPAEMDAVMNTINQTLDRHTKNNTAVLRRLLYAVSAAAVVLIAVFLLWPQPAMVNISTAFAETRRVTLPDGSVVILNANSGISYRKNWTAGHEREVELNGEAFFKVTKSPAGLHPKFRVHTALADVQVVGTAFNVRNRRNGVTVVLEEGKVMLNEAPMQPGELMTVTAGGTLRRKVDPARFSAWKERRLVFEDEPLENIAAELEDTYGYKVIFHKQSTKHLRLTGSYPAGQPGLLLAAIKAVHGINVRQQGTDITFE